MRPFLLCFIYALLATRHATAISSSSCAELKHRTNDTVEGEKILLLDGYNVSVYCYAMDQPTPLAYITLQSQNNTAEWIWGNIKFTTLFHKIRINESTLRVYTGDCKHPNKKCPIYTYLQLFSIYLAFIWLIIFLHVFLLIVTFASTVALNPAAQHNFTCAHFMGDCATPLYPSCISNI